MLSCFRVHLLILCPILLALISAGCGVALPPLAGLIAHDATRTSSETPVSFSGATVAIEPVTRTSGDALVRYTLVDPDARPATIAVLFAPPSGEFRPASERAGPPSEGTSGLATSAGGTEHVFVWRAADDLGGGGAVEGVRLRIAPSGGVAQTTAPFVVGNDPPRFVPDPIDPAQEGLVAISGTLTDSTGDRVDLRLEVVGVTSPATLRLGAAAGLVTRRASQGGTRVELAWNSLVDVPRESPALFRIVADDGLEAAAPVDLAFALRNDDRPSVFLLPIARAEGRITLEYLLLDKRADPVDLEVAFTARNGAQTIGPRRITVAEGSLRDRPSAPRGAPGSLVWDAAADLAFPGVTGPVTRVTLEVTPVDDDGRGTTRRIETLVGAAAPDAALVVPTGTARGIVPIEVVLTGEGDPADLDVTVEAPGVPSRPLTVAAGALSGLGTAPGGARHRIVWSALADLGAASVTATVRVTPRNTGVAPPIVGTPRSASIAVDNRGGAFAFLTAPVAGEVLDARGGAAVALEVILADALSRPATLLLEVDASDGRSFHPAPGGATAALATSPAGSRHALLYRPVEDGLLAADGDRTSVRFRATPSQPGIAGTPPAEAGPVALDLAPAPEARLLALGGRPPESAPLVRGTALLDVSLAGPDGMPVEVRLEVSRDGGTSFDAAAPLVATASSAAAASLIVLPLDTSAFGTDLPESLVLRLSARDTRAPAAGPLASLGAGPASLALVLADNATEPAPRIAVNAPPGVLRGAAAIPFTLSHPSGRTCAVAVDVSLGGDAPFRPAAGGLLTGLTTATGGAEVAHTFAWDPLADLGPIAAGRVRLRLTPSTIAPSGATRTGAPAAITLALDLAIEADLVLGQPALAVSPLDNRGLDLPAAVAVGGGRTWVADRGDHRVLQLDGVPAESRSGAALALGQAAFDQADAPRAPSADRLLAPRALLFDGARGRLYAGDASGRVLVWRRTPTEMGAAADLAITLPAGPSGSALPAGLALDGALLYVALARDPRIVAIDLAALPAVGAATAPAALTLGVGLLVAPAGVALRPSSAPGGFLLAAADRGAGRILLWTTPPASGAAPGATIGALEAQSPHFAPAAVAFDAAGALWALDLGAGEAIRFAGAPLAPVVSARVGGGVLAAFGAAATATADVAVGSGDATPPPPAGIAVTDDRLLVVDASRHRVLVFDVGALPAAPLVASVGQPGLSDDRPLGGRVDAFALAEPAGLASDGARLFACDRRNGRVLVYDPVPALSDTPATLALGKPDLESAEDAPGAPPEETLRAPTGIAAIDGSLLVVDPAQGTLHIWLTTPATSGAPADRVLTGLRASALAVTRDAVPGLVALVLVEPEAHRARLFRGFDLALDDPGSAPAIAIGQPDLASETPANPALPPGARLTRPLAAAFGAGGRLLVGGGGDGRSVLVFDALPSSHGAEADAVIGDAAPGPTRASLGGAPAALLAEGSGRVLLLDAGAHRLLGFEAGAEAGDPATTLFGAPLFTSEAPNAGLVSARSLHLRGETPQGAGFDLAAAPAAGIVRVGATLFVSDPRNHRILRVPIAP